MKKLIIHLLSLALVVALYTSCENIFGDYLDKAPGVDVNESTIFSSRAEVLLFLASCYEQSMLNYRNETQYRYGSSNTANAINENISFYSSISDEAEFQVNWFQSNNVNRGEVITGAGFFDPFFNHRWTALRMVHTMLAGIDGVPDADEAFKTQIKAECRHLRAEIYFEMFKRQGGLSLIDRKFRPIEVEEMKVPRSSVDSTVQFIIKDLDHAISKLPDSYPSNMRGRITKGASLALKSRVLLYAASPLYNTDTPPLSLDDPANNRLICYGNFDKNRWQKAADAAKAVLDWAPSGGIHLVTDQGVDKNYRYVWERPDNAEVILADKHADGYHRAPGVEDPWKYWMHSTVGGLAGVEPTHCFIEAHYDKRDGNPQDWPVEYGDVREKYAELDYRFHQTIGHDGFYWNQNRGNLAFHRGPGTVGANSVGNRTGYIVKKWVPDNVNNRQAKVDVDLFRYRLAEFYLNYAEALNEAQGPVAAAHQAVNIIRARSGMPPLPSGLSKEEFRERVRKERGIELAFECHRWWDLRRWRIAEELLNGPFYGLRIYKNEPETTPLTFRYEKYVFEQRTFLPKLYHYFYPIREVNLGYIKQNPGW
jgi:starch-binding outer membrane protein, SusD/RagB family